MEFVAVRCGATTSVIGADFCAPIRNLKFDLSCTFGLPSIPRLVFRGRLLDSEASLSSCGVSPGDVLIAIPPKPSRTILVKAPPADPLVLDVLINSPVSELRAEVGAMLSVSPDQLRLCHRGRLLDDRLSPGFYEFSENSVVYAAPVRRPQHRIRPSVLVHRLREKMAAFVSSPRDRPSIAGEITALIDSPALQSFVRIDPEARTVVDDAVVLLEATHRRAPSAIGRMKARINDLHIDQLETTATGLRMITEVLERPRRWRPVDDTPMNAGGERRISEHPLPVWWKLDVERIARCQRERQGPMKARFSRQIGVLKRMGFGDESVILTALTEAAGNVPRAAKLLMRNVPSR